MTPSPCTGLCALDVVTGWCRGCGRTLDEIGGWLEADETAKHAIVARLPARLRALAQ